MTDQKTEKAIRAAITLLDGDLDHENAEAMRSLLSKLRAEGVQAGDERAVMAEATAYVTEALIYVDRVAQRKAIGYADVGTNPRRHHNDTRPYNIKDARSDAYTAALLLRKAWDLLDPSISLRPVTALASAPVAAVCKCGPDCRDDGAATCRYSAPVADAVDAARYRWLRRWKGQEHEPPFTVQHEEFGTLWLGDLDHDIDAALASAPVAGEAAQKAKHDTAHAKTKRERVTALAYWLDQQTFKPGMLSIAAATLRAMLSRDAAPQASEAVRPSIPPAKPLPDLMMASYHEAIGWNACRDAMLVTTASPPVAVGSAVQEFIAAVDALLAAEARETWSPAYKQKLTTADRMRITETYRRTRAALKTQADKDGAQSPANRPESRASIESKGGALDGGDCAKGAHKGGSDA